MNWPKIWRALKSNAIFRAFGVSVLLHMVFFIVVELGNSAGLWKVALMPKKLAQLTPAQIQQLQQQQNSEPPVLRFVEVDPLQQAEPPKETPLYSNANTQAGNPDTSVDLNKPKIDGRQVDVLKTRDLSKGESRPTPPPQPPPQNQRAELQPAVKQTPQEPPGDTKQNTLTPQEKAQRDLTFDRPSPATKPRTLADARAQKGITETPKIKQDGGVKKFAIESDLDVKASPFGAYDAAFIAAVQARWDQLLAQRNYVYNQSGRVVIHFRLYKDGTIRQLKVESTAVSETLTWACQRAITDPAPYGPFPNDLRRLLGKDYRDIRFTFLYN